MIFVATIEDSARVFALQTASAEIADGAPDRVFEVFRETLEPLGLVLNEIHEFESETVFEIPAIPAAARKPLEFRAFNSNDWAHFAGAERFSLSSRPGFEEPRIAPLKVGLEDGIAIVTPRGVSIFWSALAEDGADYEIFFTGPFALRALAILSAETTRGELLALGGIEI